MTAAELREVVRTAERVARDFGLDFDPVVFEVVDWETMAMLAAYGGFPRRYPHWRWGVEYARFKQTARYGLSRIYELVVNTSPVYAYLLESNPPLAQKVVIAHIYGHADFFKNNAYFAPTPKEMHNELANHAALVERLAERHGRRAVEEFLDLALSLENLIDPHAPYIQRHHEPLEEEPQVRLPVRVYLDPYVNPPADPPKEADEGAQIQPIPAQPERDVLGFLVEHAPLAPWQKAILEVIREEAYYFAPQAMTKIMNEGWATFWHTRILVQGGLLKPEEVLEFAEMQAGVLGGEGFNPYRLGYHLYRYMEEKAGLEALFRARSVHDDVSFLDEWLTLEFAEMHKVIAPGDEETFKAAKDRLLFALTNAGNPIVYVIDANFENRGELVLYHAYEGVEIELKRARAVLENLYRLWGRAVHLETVVDEEPVRLSYDGAHRHEVL